MKILSINPYTSQNRNQNYPKNRVNFGSMLVLEGDFNNFKLLYPKSVSLGQKLLQTPFRRLSVVREFIKKEIYSIEKSRKTQDVFLHPHEIREFDALLEAVGKELRINKGKRLVVNAEALDTFSSHWQSDIASNQTACKRFSDYVKKLNSGAEEVKKEKIVEFVAQFEPVRVAFAESYGAKANHN